VLRPHDTAEEVLRWAFSLEARIVPPAKRDPFRSSPCTDGALSFLERRAEAALIRAKVDRYSRAPQRDLLYAVYTVPVGQTLQQRKSQCCTVVADFLNADLHKPRWWMVHSVRTWCRCPTVHTREWWATHLGVSTRTLQRWQSVTHDRLDDLLVAANGGIEPFLMNGKRCPPWWTQQTS